MNRDNLTEGILKSIEERHITPKPKWHYALKDTCVWGIALGAFIAGSIGMALVLFAFENSDFDVRSYVEVPFFEHVFKTVPLVWVLGFALSGALVYYNIRHTRKGYRYALAFVLSGAFVLSSFMGYIVYSAGFAEPLEKTLGNHMPGYTHVLAKRAERWSNAPGGLLLGNVIQNDSDGMYIEDIHGKKWHILTDNVSPYHSAIMRHAETVGIVGKMVDESTFSACAVRPWFSGRPVSPLMVENASRTKERVRDDRAHSLTVLRERLIAEGIDERSIRAVRSKECEWKGRE